MSNKTIGHPQSYRLRPIRVLMADPDESLQPEYRGPLLQEGFELVTAVNGLECVARMRERVPDLLVLEPQLPWGGGEGGSYHHGRDSRTRERTRHGAYIVPRFPSLGSCVAVSGK